MCRISIDNGRNWTGIADELEYYGRTTVYYDNAHGVLNYDKLLEALTPYMDAEICESLHGIYLDAHEYLKAYMETDAPDICIG